MLCSGWHKRTVRKKGRVNFEDSCKSASNNDALQYRPWHREMFVREFENANTDELYVTKSGL